MLKFSTMRHNAKLKQLLPKLGLQGNQAWSFSLPSGYSCPFARLCLSKTNKITGKIQDGAHTQYRCYSASEEAFFPAVRRQRWHNFDTLRGLNQSEMFHALRESLPKQAKLVRVHVGGDFYNPAYFGAWMSLALSRSDVRFYAYTKSLKYWVDFLGHVPSNFVLTASRGGSQDELIQSYGLRECVVVNSTYQARKLRLPIDHDDSHAIKPGGSFALLIHGIQPKGSAAGKAVRRLNGKGSYGEKSELRRLTAGKDMV